MILQWEDSTLAKPVGFKLVGLQRNRLRPLAVVLNAQELKYLIEYPSYLHLLYNSLRHAPKS